MGLARAGTGTSPVSFYSNAFFQEIIRSSGRDADGKVRLR